MTRIVTFAFALLAAHATTADTVWGTLRAEPDVSAFANLVEQSEFKTVLDGTTDHTVFAPDNGAFAAMSTEVRDALNAAPQSQATRDFIARHIVVGRVAVNLDVGQDITVKLLSGDDKTFRSTFVGCGAFAATIDGIPLTITDFDASNGVLHIIAAPIE